MNNIPKYKNGEIITKKFEDMELEELRSVNLLTLGEEDFFEWSKWRKTREEERMAPLYY